MEQRELALIRLQPNWVFLFFLQYERTVYGSHIIGDGWTPLADVASAIPQSIYCLLLYERLQFTWRLSEHPATYWNSHYPGQSAHSV